MKQSARSGATGPLMPLIILLAHSVYGQYEAKQDDGLDDLTMPMHGEACGYGSCLPIKPGWLNVHLVPQTHSELGHGYNFYQHFTGEDPPLPKNTINMKRILDAIVTELWKDDSRRFTLSDTVYLFHWWNNRHPAVRRMMHELVRQGRLTIVGGGLGISDEASTSYHAIIDQFTYSLRKLNETFRACARPLVAWATDVYGHSREFTSLMAQMGYDALFVNPISYDEEVARIRRKSLEFVWRGSDDLGPVTDLFTHNLFDGYWAPPGFCFSKICSDPLLVTSSRLFSDIQDRVDKFIEVVLYRQAPNFETRNIMVIMGHRKAYSDADVWFDNIEKLIRFTNWRAHQKRLNITLFYSNPPCYLAAVHDEKPELETKQDDFFPYVHDKDSYTVGMYTSRPTFKYLIREAHIYLQIVKQIQITANMGPFTRLFEDFKWLMGVVQDHSVATGVLRESVKQYYTIKLDSAISRSTDMISKAFTKLRKSPNHVPYYRCQFNISSCYGSRFIKYSIQVYNPLGWPVTMPIRLPVYPHNNKFVVYDADGEEVKSATIKLPDPVLRIKDRPEADHELVFIATDIPPVGYRAYYIESHYDKGSGTINMRGSGEDYNELTDEIENTKKHDMKVLGLNTTKSNYKRTVGSRGNFIKNTQSKIVSTAPQMLSAEVLKGTANDYMRNMIEVDDPEYQPMEHTTELVLLPMLRDFLQKSKVLRKLDFIDTDRELLSSNELDNFEALDIDGTSAAPDIAVPFKRNTTIADIMVQPDIRISILRRTTKEPDILVPTRMSKNKNDLKLIFKTTTESDIRVPVKFRPEPDIRVVVDADIEVPNKRTFRTKTDNVPKSLESDETNTDSLAIVPVRTTTTTAATDSILVVPVRKPTPETFADTTQASPSSDSILLLTERKDQEESIATTTEPVLLPAASSKENLTQARKQMFHVSHYFKRKSNVDSSTLVDLDADAQNDDIEEIEASERFKTRSHTTETIEASTDMETTSVRSDDTVSSTDARLFKSTTSRNIMTEPSPSLVATRTTPIVTTVSSNEKYFKVEDGSKLFIGNRYVRVNIDNDRRVASVFLRNGVRINLSILMFHYVSDDPSKFDIRTVPKRTIKSPGAYIFRPIDPYIIRAENNYGVRITKTDIVDEMHVRYNNWTSLSLRLYVDSPVIEVHWLVGPIPTDDGLGRDVFIRYQTDLQHDGTFYTDSNGRQTIKRIRGTRATYDPVELDPITGNLYPVTSKIYIEDPTKNIRFAVFNDRCQAGGAVIDGAIDLMVHRRILTDDIGFGAFLNETEHNEGIRAAGVHYLYLTKANRNRIFEKKFAKEISLAPRVLTSDHVMYADDMRRHFYNCKNEFSALRDKLPLGVHLLSLERIAKGELLIRLENYLEKVDVTTDGVRYVPLRSLFRNIKIIWLKEAWLAGNLYKDQWEPTQWRRKNKFYRRFNEYYGGGNDTFEEKIEPVKDELGGRGIRLAPQQIKTFIVKYEYTSD